MKAVFRHEVSSYFTGITAYVFGAFLLLFTGIYMMVINLNSSYTNFEYVLSNMSFIFLLIVPILTMRVIAEERRQRTDQLLYSLPIGMTKVALGKYFAMLVVFAVPVAIICFYPLILSAFGNVYLPAAYSSIVGFFFLGAALISIGMFISSLTESQAVAAGLCFVVMLVNYLISSLADYISSTAFASFVCVTVIILLLALIVRLMTKSSFVSIVTVLVLEVPTCLCYILWSDKFEGLIQSVLDNLSLFDRFYTFVDGIFDVSSIIYFITVIGVFIFLTVQSLEKRRWS